jgi:hypothetical protein
MLTLAIDFNAHADGLVRGLQEEVEGDGDLVVGAAVRLTDGEGNEALGVLHEVRDGLVFTEVDWDTWSAGEVYSYSYPAQQSVPSGFGFASGDAVRLGGRGAAVIGAGDMHERVPVLA